MCEISGSVRITNDRLAAYPEKDGVILSQRPDRTIREKLDSRIHLKQIIAIVVFAMSMSGCGASGNGVTPTATGANGPVFSLAEDQKHRLYSAALAASESPLDSDLFKAVCKKIGIFDAQGNPNDKYMTFVQEHIAWSTKPEIEPFRHEINTREKAGEYIRKYRP